MPDYTLRARWIYLNEAERIEFVSQSNWIDCSVIGSSPHWVTSKSGISDPDLLEDFGRFVSTIYKYGQAYRIQDRIRMGLQVKNFTYLVDYIDHPDLIDTIYKTKLKVLA